MATFSPSTFEQGIGTQVSPVRYYRLTESSSVVRVNGVLTAIRYPRGDLLTGEEGVDYFMGGRRYTITNAVRDELFTAGFRPNWLDNTWSNANFGPGSSLQVDLYTLRLTSTDPGAEYAIRQVGLPVAVGTWGLTGRVFRPTGGTSPYLDFGAGPTLSGFSAGWTDLASLGSFSLNSSTSTVLLGGSKGLGSPVAVFQDIKLYRIS